jgi:hypothetical protein
MHRVVVFIQAAVQLIPPIVDTMVHTGAEHWPKAGATTTTETTAASVVAAWSSAREARRGE